MATAAPEACVMAARLPSPFIVVDDFMEPTSFLQILSQMPDICSQSLNSKELQLKIPLGTAHRLQDCLKQNESKEMCEENGIVDDEVEELHAETSLALRGRIEVGSHREHADVSLAGEPVPGRVCVVYVGGTGTFILTDALERQRGKVVEHRVEVRQNRAVCWDNSRYTHRIEAAADAVPRLMLGPCSLDPRGKLMCTMSPKGMHRPDAIAFCTCCALCCLAAALAAVLVPPILMVECLVRLSGDADCTSQIVLAGFWVPCILCFLCASAPEDDASSRGPGILAPCWPGCVPHPCGWRRALFSCVVACCGPRRPSRDPADNAADVTPRPQGFLNFMGDVIAKGQEDFCTQCVLVGQELVREKKLAREDVEAVDPKFVVGLPAIVTFRFLARSAGFGDRFVFKDGCVLLDSALPNWHPLIYIFLARLRTVRHSLGNLKLSDAEVHSVEMKFLGINVDEQNHGPRAFDVNKVITDINSMAIDISTLAFYRERLRFIAQSIVELSPVVTLGGLRNTVHVRVPHTSAEEESLLSSEDRNQEVCCTGRRQESSDEEDSAEDSRA